MNFRWFLMITTAKQEDCSPLFHLVWQQILLPLYLYKLALTSPTSGSRLASIVHSRTKNHGVICIIIIIADITKVRCVAIPSNTFHVWTYIYTFLLHNVNHLSCQTTIIGFHNTKKNNLFPPMFCFFGSHLIQICKQSMFNAVSFHGTDLIHHMIFMWQHSSK
jgi:hypothetical protein